MSDRDTHDQPDAGCVHDCAYCYIRGYSQYPGVSRVHVYRDTAKRVAMEFQRKRTRPAAVYFSPSSDAFMPVQDVLDEAYATMQTMLHHGIGIQFVTKGRIPQPYIDLFAQTPKRIAGQVGLCTLDDALNRVLEPHAALAIDRLDVLKQLTDIGVQASLRVDPLIHGVADGDDNLHELFANASSRGIAHVSVSYLFLRPAIKASLSRQITDTHLLERILTPIAMRRIPVSMAVTVTSSRYLLHCERFNSSASTR